jgi:four helix bundle protein
MLTLDKSAARTFRDSAAWQSAHELTLAVYSASSTFPRREAFGLTTELRRCVASVGATVAEGFGRNSWSELRRCTQMASGALEEAKYYLMLAADLTFLDREECKRLLEMAEKTGALIAAMDRRPQQDLFQH